MLGQGQHRKLLNHTKKLGNVQFLSYLKSQSETLHTIFSIQKYLQSHPVFYLNSILTFLKGRDISFIQPYLAKEYEELLKGTSFMHRMNANVSARSKCINKIKRDLTRAAKVLGLFAKEYSGDGNDDAVYADWVEVEGYTAVEVDESIENSIKLLSSIFVDMSRLRDMTIYIVESIHSWRSEIQEHADRCQQHSPVHYFYDNVDVYQIISQDTNFIWTSRLSSYIWMQAKQDPFIIRNVIHVEEKQTKTPLEKYFLEILYPKNEEIVEKSLKCYEMLVFKYKPKITNLFEEEELLIENYLKLELKNHEFDEEYPANQNHKKVEEILKKQVQDFRERKELEVSPDKRHKLNPRGWVFERGMKSKNREKINQIIESHNDKIGLINPNALGNLNNKNSIALAYLSQAKEQQSPHRNKIMPSKTSYDRQKRFYSQQEGSHKQPKKREKQIQSEPETRRVSESRMFKSLTKLNAVIEEDPKQHLPDTPKHAHKQINNTPPLISREPSLNHIKLNSFFPSDYKQEEIEIEEEETPLNIKQFFEVFRADTNKARKQAFAEGKKETEADKIITFRQFLFNSRKERAKSLQSRKPSTLLLKKKDDVKKPQVVKNNSYTDFTVVNEKKDSDAVAETTEKKDFSKIFINLKAKSVPQDLVVAYMKHISSQIHSTSHSFTDFKPSQALRKLSDPFIHCIIFDVFTEKQEHLGQVILSESVSGRAGKLKYTVEFMNIHIFEFVISTVLRISEELLATSPCEEVIFPFIVDKLDLVSTHFIELIDSGLREKVGKFGKLSILQKARPSLKGTDVRDRLYVFTTEPSLKRQYELGLKMMGNYRSLKFQAKCLVMCSNFRLRSKDLFKNTLKKYKYVALGELYVRAMSKVLTKYHLKQLKTASYSMDTEDELTQLLRKDIFVRNIISNLMNYLKEDCNDEILNLTVFKSMADLIHYLQYKKHDTHFQMHFLEESRFILNHQLVLIEFQQEASLDFSLTSNNQLYLLHNHKQIPITMLRSKNLDTPIYLIPTPNDKIKLFFFSATEYLTSTTDQLDIYSYICYFFKDIHSEVNLNTVPTIVLPNLKQRNARISPVRMYDGFFKLFPERQFYSASMIACLCHWDSYYPHAVIHLPKENSIVFDYPFVVGFYDTRARYPIAAYLYTEDCQPSP